MTRPGAAGREEEAAPLGVVRAGAGVSAGAGVAAGAEALLVSRLSGCGSGAGFPGAGCGVEADGGLRERRFIRGCSTGAESSKLNSPDAGGEEAWRGSSGMTLRNKPLAGQFKI